MARLSRGAYVNMSGYSIDVYDSLVQSSIHAGGRTAGGTKIGTIYQFEYYIVLTNKTDYTTYYEILFRNSNGGTSSGYIEICKGETLGDKPWASLQEPYMYYNSNGGSLVKSSAQTIDGLSGCRIFTVQHSDIYYCDPDTREILGYLSKGTKIATRSSAVGNTYHWCMLFNKIQVNGTWKNLVSGKDHGFVFLGLPFGSMPSNRAIW